MFSPRVIIRSLGILAAAILLAAPAHASVPILLYHHIAQLPANATPEQRRWTITPEKFDAQMQWVTEHGFHPVTMAQLTAHLKHGQALPNRPIVITFDDGWKDQYEAALPILKKHDFPATFFIITDSVGHSAYMNWGQVLQMSEEGMDIEPHSLTHQRLSILPVEQARKEIDDSKSILEQHLHKRAVVFAYPFGSYGDKVINLVKDAGFESAVTVSGLNGGYLLRADQTYTFSRYAIEGGDDLDNIAQLRSGSGPVCSAMFVSLVQEPSIFSSRKAMEGLIDFSSRSGIKTLFVQVYRENKSWFASQVADSSPYEKSRKDISDDPLALLIRKAHYRGIQVHAWLNLLSLAKNRDSKFLKQYGTDILTRNLQEKKKLTDYMIDSQYFLEPGDMRVRQDLSKIVGELVKAYPDLDGIQFDYIRYPDSQPHYGYTQGNVERFKKSAGLEVIDEDGKAWKEWKRSQVTELLTLLTNTARAMHPGIQVSTTGCMPYARAYQEAYQDWLSWISRDLVDFVTIMDYSPEPVEFKRWLAVIQEKVSDPLKIKVGVGAYKLAGKPGIFGREFHSVEELGLTGAVFHYGSLLDDPDIRLVVLKENDRKEFR